MNERRISQQRIDDDSLRHVSTISAEDHCQLIITTFELQLFVGDVDVDGCLQRPKYGHQHCLATEVATGQEYVVVFQRTARIPISQVAVTNRFHRCLHRLVRLNESDAYSAERRVDVEPIHATDQRLEHVRMEFVRMPTKVAGVQDGSKCVRCIACEVEHHAARAMVRIDQGDAE